MGKLSRDADTKRIVPSKGDVDNSLDTDNLPPPPPYSSISGSQTLSIHYRAWSSHVIVRDSAGNELFTSSVPGAYSTHLTFYNRHGKIIGTSKSSTFSSKITVDIVDPVSQSFEMHNSAGILGGSPKYMSAAFDGKELTWRNKALSTKIIYELQCAKGKGDKALARFQSDPFTKVGTLEVGDVQGEERLNELVVTLLTLLHRKLRNIQISNSVVIT
jgi:hypothetical protein